MKKYVYIDDNIVREIVPEYVNDFPDVTITERYAPEWLEKCVVVNESVEVEDSWIYDAETGNFREPIPESEEVQE